jgi:hypothetical protein
VQDVSRQGARYSLPLRYKRNTVTKNHRRLTAVSRDTLKKYHDSKNRHYTGAFRPNVSLVLGIIGNGIGEVGLLLSRLGD